MCGYTGWLSVIIIIIFIFICFRLVLGLLFVSFSLFCFVLFLACLKTEPCSLCTNMFAFGNIIIVGIQ